MWTRKGEVYVSEVSSFQSKSGISVQEKVSSNVDT